MPVGNQYGIDMGNILSTVSSLKTAQQNRDTNAIQQNRLSRQNKEEIATNQSEQDYMKDPTTAVAHTIAQKLQWDTLDDAKKAQATTAMKQRINEHGVAINGVMGIQDPAQQGTALQQYISNLSPQEQQDISTKYGNNLQQWQSNLPHMMNDLIVADGGITLLAKRAETKTNHDYKMEEKGANNALASRGTEKEFQQLMTALDNETDPERKKMIQSRLTKLSQPSMTSLLTNMNTVKDAQANFSQSVGLESPYKLATVDTSKWTPEQRAEGNQLSKVIIKGLGGNAKEVEKKMGEYGALSEQMKNAIDAYESVGISESGFAISRSTPI